MTNQLGDIVYKTIPVVVEVKLDTQEMVDEYNALQLDYLWFEEHFNRQWHRTTLNGTPHRP